MIIPIKCFTCGCVLADKYRYYMEQVRYRKLAQGKQDGNEIQIDKIIYLTKETVDKTPEGMVLDELGLRNVCCRRHMLTHVDIE